VDAIMSPATYIAGDTQQPEYRNLYLLTPFDPARATTCAKADIRRAKMRRKILIASAGATFLGLIAPVFAQPATEPTHTGPDYNTSGPGRTNQSNPQGAPLSGYGTPPAGSRTTPGDRATSQQPATVPSTTGPNYNTGDPAATNQTRTRTSPSGRNYPGPNQQSAAKSGKGPSANTTATSPSVSRPQYNTQGPADTNQTRPMHPAPGTNDNGNQNR
jgi:hypothetical protein